MVSWESPSKGVTSKSRPEGWGRCDQAKDRGRNTVQKTNQCRD
jgi:hypothetical protein